MQDLVQLTLPQELPDEDGKDLAETGRGDEPQGPSASIAGTPLLTGITPKVRIPIVVDLLDYYRPDVLDASFHQVSRTIDTTGRLLTFRPLLAREGDLLRSLSGF